MVCCLFGTSVRKTSIATPSQFVGIEGVELGTVDKVQCHCVQYLLFPLSTKRRMILALNLSPLRKHGACSGTVHVYVNLNVSHVLYSTYLATKLGYFLVSLVSLWPEFNEMSLACTR